MLSSTRWQSVWLQKVLQPDELNFARSLSVIGRHDLSPRPLWNGITMLEERLTALLNDALQRKDYALSSVMVRSLLHLTEQPRWLFEAAKLYLLLGYKQMASIYIESFVDAFQACLVGSPLHLSLQAIAERDFPELEKLAASVMDAEPNSNDYNMQFRLRSMADAINQRFPEQLPSVLDVGGGRGDLSHYLHGHRYFLVEPSINGISGLALPFPDNSFDCVVSSHVYEHIVQDQRIAFLDELSRVAKHSVLMLNPFWIEQNDLVVSSLESIYAFSQASWAIEHLECGMPKIDEVCQWATQRGYDCKYQPNGNKPLTIAMVFVQLLAERQGQHELLRELTDIFMRFDTAAIDSAIAPNAYLVEINK